MHHLNTAPELFLKKRSSIYDANIYNIIVNHERHEKDNTVKNLKIFTGFPTAREKRETVQ